MDFAITDLKRINQKVYRHFIEPVANQYGLSRAEFDVLLFLANNPKYDTATDIVEFRGITKSHVSAAVAKLEEKGYLERSFRNGNRRTVHLTITKKADCIVENGRTAQKNYVAFLHEGISEEEIAMLNKIVKKIADNASRIEWED